MYNSTYFKILFHQAGSIVWFPLELGSLESTFKNLLSKLFIKSETQFPT